MDANGCENVTVLFSPEGQSLTALLERIICHTGIARPNGDGPI